MGRENAIPRTFFGAIDSKWGIPRNNVIFTGGLALAGAFVLTYQFAAEMLNFGAFLAFMGVNAAAFHRYYVRGERTVSNSLAPLAGLAICFYLWLHLRTPARIAGCVWLAVGVLYGVWKTRSFCGRAISFEISSGQGEQ
jgi:amino acid transporter